MGGTTSNCCLSALLSCLRSPSQYQNDDYIIVMFATTTRQSRRPTIINASSDTTFEIITTI